MTNWYNSFLTLDRSALLVIVGTAVATLLIINVVNYNYWFNRKRERLDVMEADKDESECVASQNGSCDGAVEDAEKLKDEANKFFKKGEYDKAIELYNKAINLNPNASTYYGNRSFAYLKTEMFGAALADANRALELDNTFVKGYYRRAAANMSLGKFKLALKDFEIVCKVRPNDKAARLKYSECNKIVKQKAFEKAIANDDTSKSVLDTLDIQSITITDDYKGAKLLEDGVVTLEFVKQILEEFKEEKRLHRKFVFEILRQVKTFFLGVETLVDISIPEGSRFTVCGDIHGQFYDLLNIFQLNGLPSEDNPYLFNGDFVDRGSFSVEVIISLFALKLLYPSHLFLARGNHETETMNQMYGFEGEVRAKYSPDMALLFTEIYNLLPLAHLINGRVLVAHGGLFSEEGVKLSDIRGLQRNRQPPESGIMCDLLWSDPMGSPGRAPSKRGVGTQFGPDVTKRFCDENKLDYIIRSHEVKPEGYEVAHDSRCITIFSAPNYCDSMGNKGAFINLVAPQLKPQFVTYDAVPHPKVRPMAFANRLLGLLG